MKTRTFCKSIFSFILAITIFIIPCLPSRADEVNAIYIKSTQDLIVMANECRLDTNSLGKTYILSNDITIDSGDFKQIPVFRGTFEGGGHTISGFIVDTSIAPIGLFGIIEVEGVVKNLKLTGKVLPSGEGESIGGIAGHNRGLIESCDFNGTVAGKEEVGGIVGINEFSGIIRDCTSTGKINGQKMSGGIVGNNHGMVDSCKNASYVDVDSSDPSISIDEIESDMQSSMLNREEAEKIYSAIEDVGGIAGFSDGTVTNCENSGNIGYNHIGYNIGGVVGRNQGFLFGSKNSGTIYGRREVGGIAGQAEPFIAYRPSADNVSNIRDELRILRDLVDKATRDVDDASTRASSRLTNINSIISRANDNIKDLSDALTDAVENDLNEVDRGENIAKSVSSRLASISRKLPGISSKIADALDQLSKGMEESRKAGTKAADAMGDFSLAADDLSVAVAILEEGNQYISEGTSQISQAIDVDKLNKPNIDWNMVKEGVKLISYGVEILDKGNSTSGGKGVYHYLSSASAHIKDGTSKLKVAAQDMDTALGYMEKSTDILSDVSKDVTVVLNEIASLADFISNTDSLQFSHVKTRTEQSGNDLHNNMTNLNRELDALNVETKSSSDILTADIRNINDQFFVVMDLLLDEIDDFKNISFISRIEDISDEDINNSTDGKVQFCLNYGIVGGDINVGGITGSMGIFNEQNPEDDNVTINDTLRARYKLKAILQDCTNYGDITSKKDYVGAVCGISSLGVITNCKGYGKVTSENGDYAGGISGGNSTTIRHSYAKCSISGGKYVGGITGLNSTKDNGAGSITNCIAAVEILDHEQYSGAICGYDEGEIVGNYFFGDYTGINNASYSGKAEPLSFDQLSAIEDIPVEFKQFKVSFIAGDEVIREITLDYLDSFGEEEFPPIPKIEGQYGKWDKNSIEQIDFDKYITAEYYPYVTAIASAPEDGIPSKFLAIGKFSDTSTLAVEATSDIETDFKSLQLPGEFFSISKPKESWRITVDDLEGDNVYLRYYVGENKPNSIRIFINNGDIWKKITAEEVGTYLQFEVPSGTNSIVIASRTSYIIFFVILILLAILGVTGFLFVPRIKGKTY